MVVFRNRNSEDQTREDGDISTEKPENRHASSLKVTVDTSPEGTDPASAPHPPDSPAQPSIDDLPQLIEDLTTAETTSGEKPARVLRHLFALSEHSSTHEHRTDLVHLVDGRLVPALLDFLERCGRGTSEQYLALLVLNNISIPNENKRLIALDYGGAHLLAQLLCDDPSCHLVAIILVNLTFTEEELRVDLAATEHEIHLVESLAYALRVASLTQEEYEERQPMVENDPDDPKTPHDMLLGLLAEDHRQRSVLDTLDTSFPATGMVVPDPSHQLFPETARWCVTAIKNLTRPSKDSTAALTLIKTGIVPHILRYITVSQEMSSGANESAHTAGESSNSSNDTPEPADPLYVDGCYENRPSQWDCFTAQDAALFVIMNLAAVPAGRDYVREVGGVEVLASITNFEERASSSIEELDLIEFQCLKARMALVYLFGSEGHFGQPKGPKSLSASDYSDSNDHSVVLMSENEVMQMVEVLSNTLHRRTKDGAGGYSAATFSLKYVLFAIRCALTHYENQVRFANIAGVLLNTLLMKVVAFHVLQESSQIDEEATEHACFSLYLLSGYGFAVRGLVTGYGFKLCFLPADFRHNNVAAKVLTAYHDMETVTPAGRHAAQQLLLRIKYLVFEGQAWELASIHSIRTSDLTLTSDLIDKASLIYVGALKSGAKPLPSIFDRPICRSRAIRKGSNVKGSNRSNRKSPWDNNSSMDTFPTALHAVQELSFGSTRVRHQDHIDDIQIANNIANSANGEKTESYNYLWSWQDTAGEIQRNLERKASKESFLSFPKKGKRTSDALAFVRLDSLCGFDTTTL